MKNLLGLFLLVLFYLNAHAQVYDGQPINASVTNGAYIQKNVTDTDLGQLNLNNSAGASGSEVFNIQRELNSISSFTGKPLNEPYNYTPSWTNNDVGTSSDSVKVRADNLTQKFNGTTGGGGHAHTGADGDGAQINLTTSVTGTLPISNGGTGQTTANAAFDALCPMTTTGDLEYFNSTPTAARLPIGSTNNILTVVSGLPAWAPPQYTGTVTSVGLTPPASIMSVSPSTITTSGTFVVSLVSQPANTVWAGPTATPSGAPTFRALVSADIPNNAANTTGTASNVTGTVVVSNGGTGDTSFTAYAPIAGGITSTGALQSLSSGISNSGYVLTSTGSSSAPTWQAASGNLPLTTLGDTLYEGPGPAPTRLPGNATTTKNFLTQTGTGSASAAPAWGTIAGSDLPSSSTAVTSLSNLATVGTIGTGTWNGSVVGIAYGGTDNGSLSVAAGGVIYTDGTKLQNVGAGTSGQVLESNGSGAPTWATTDVVPFVPTFSQATASGVGTGGFSTNTAQEGWLFTITTSATITSGATYTNNSNTYTVQNNLSAASGQVLFVSFATPTPTPTGSILAYSSGTGTATVIFTAKTPLYVYTVPTPTPLYIDVEMAGGGSGGGGAAATPGNSTAGSGTFFGNALFGAAGGAATNGFDSCGSVAAANYNSAPWGGSSIATVYDAFTGLIGGGGGNNGSYSNVPGAAGAPTMRLGGGGMGGPESGTGQNAIANSGAGGGGANDTNASSAPGGCSGAYFHLIIKNSNLLASYPYAVGTGGPGGTSAGSGAAGVIKIWEKYQ